MSTTTNPLSNSGGWKASIKPIQLNSNHQTLLSPSRKQSMLKKPFEILSSVSNNSSDNDNDNDDSIVNNTEFNKLIIDESKKNQQNNNNNNNNNVNSNNKYDTVKLTKQNSLKFNEFLTHVNNNNQLQQQNYNNNGGTMKINNLTTENQEILVKIWLPMEYTGTLYKVRKFSGGKSTLDILTILNSQLAPFYQSPKNKLFLNNDDKPLPSSLTLSKLNLSKTDVIYIRREPEYEISVPAYPNKGTLVLDKDIKVVEILQKIELWLFGSSSSSTTTSTAATSGTSQQGDFSNDITDEVHKDGHEQESNYNLLKKLSLPNSSTTTGKKNLNRGYYLRLFDQKQISNYGIKIKDTLVFKKKVLNRGLGVDDAEGGIEITVIYSPLSMYPTPSELIVNHDNSEGTGLTPPVSPQLRGDGILGTPTTSTTANLGGGFNNIIATTMIKIEKPLLINDVNDHHNHDENNKNLNTNTTGKSSKKTPSGVGLPFNVQHKTHVDYEYKWTGSNVEESFEFKEKLGQGGYGAVFRVSHRETGFNLAVKVLSVTPTRLKDIEKEMDLLKKCRCPNVLSYYGSISKLTELWILMDYCAVGSIKDMMKTCCDTLDEDQISAVTLSVLGGLGYLHSKGIVHLDVKAANILLTEDKQIKMADFGVSQQLSTEYGHSSVLIGSPLYMAPELILKAPFSAKADIWSLGITLIELAEGRPPGRGLKNMNQLLEIPNMPPPKLSNPKDWSPSFNDFLSKCLTKDPEQRPSVSELLSHPFMQNAKSTDVLNVMMKQCLSIKEAQIKEFEDNLNNQE